MRSVAAEAEAAVMVVPLSEASQRQRRVIELRKKARTTMSAQVVQGLASNLSRTDREYFVRYSSAAEPVEAKPPSRELASEKYQRSRLAGLDLFALERAARS